jgi:hypothetical protein
MEGGKMNKGFIACLAALGALSFSALVNAQTYSESQAYFACGCVVLDPWAGGGGGIDNLNVGGDLFDVTFTNTAPATSPFVLSNSTAAPGQPLTGIDAANAIAAFYATLQPPYANGYPIAGDPGPAFVTAFGPSGSLSSAYFGSTELFDTVDTSVGAGGSVAVAGQYPGTDSFLTASGQNVVTAGGSGPFYTTWTPIAALAAPEIDPVSAVSALTLLVGGIVVLRGRRPGQRVS